MPKTLPVALVRHARFPSIYRFITEEIISERTLYYTKLLIVSILSSMILLQIVTQAIALQENRKLAELAQLERQNITGEIVYWKNLSTQYKGYRDIYFRIASLEYRLGKKDEAKSYVKKAMELDPNFEAGRVLGEKVGL